LSKRIDKSENDQTVQSCRRWFDCDVARFHETVQEFGHIGAF
jgi:hypothetical protein